MDVLSCDYTVKVVAPGGRVSSNQIVVRGIEYDCVKAKFKRPKALAEVRRRTFERLTVDESNLRHFWASSGYYSTRLIPGFIKDDFQICFPACLFFGSNRLELATNLARRLIPLQNFIRFGPTEGTESRKKT